MEKNEGRVKIARRRTALYLWLEILSAMMDLYSAEEEYFYFPVTGSPWLLTSSDYPYRTGHNDLEVRVGLILTFCFAFCARSFMSASVPRPTHLIALSNICKEKLAALLRPEKVPIPA